MNEFVVKSILYCIIYSRKLEELHTRFKAAEERANMEIATLEANKDHLSWSLTECEQDRNKLKVSVHSYLDLLLFLITASAVNIL